jgi:polyisoprenyl-phosphate glycosyltransferase
MKPTFSIVSPVHNEEKVLPELHRRISEVMDQTCEPWELVLVNDGSKDRSAEVIAQLHQQDPRVRGVSFARNFGFQVAVTAGLDHAQGDAVVLIDADLQDPPEVILDMIAKWREGYDVVYGVRSQREGETWFKKFTAKAFYRLIHRITSVNIPLDTGDFRLMDWRVVNAIRQMPERNRFLRGMVSWVGYRQTGVYYNRHARFAGETKFSVRKMTRFAMDAITGFSYFPLQLASYLGFIIAAVSAIAIPTVILLRLYGPTHELAGQATTLVAVLFLGGVQLICLGIIGEYLGRIYDEVKGRPLYLVDKKWGYEEESGQTAGSRQPTAALTSHEHTDRSGGE